MPHHGEGGACFSLPTPACGRILSWRLPPVPITLPALHHERHAAPRRNIGQRIALHRHQIRLHPHRDRTNIRHPHTVRRHPPPPPPPRPRRRRAPPPPPAPR